MTSSQFSTWQPLTSRINFRFHFNSVDVLRRSEYVNVPNFIINNDISSHGWVIITSSLGKRTAAIVKFYFRLRFKHVNRHRHLILHWNTKFHMNRTIGGIVMTTSKYSRRWPLKSRINLRLQFDSSVVLRIGSLSVPNFANMSCQILQRSVASPECQCYIVWLMAPLYDFRGFWSVTVNSVYKLNFYIDIFAVK